MSLPRRPTHTDRVETPKPHRSWYYPKYTTYGVFSVLAVAYTTISHALFKLRLLSKPKIRAICATTHRDKAKREKPMKDVKDETSPLTTSRTPLSRRVAIVTGSNTGCGFATAKKLVLEYGMDVILACRSAEKARVAVDQINQEVNESNGKHGGRAIFLECLDLSHFASIHAFAQVIKDKYSAIHILVNNAGLNTTGRTDDGYDLLFQTCFLGHFLLTNLLLDLFPDDASGRIVNLSSVKHHFQSNWSGYVTIDEQFWKNCALLEYKRNENYPNAKLAAIFFTLELNRRFYHNTSNSNNKRKRVRAFVANPGAVNSDIWRSANHQWLIRPLWRMLFLTTNQGCSTSVAAAVHQGFDKDDYYLEPYWMPSSAAYKAPFPVLEMLGPYVGFEVTTPRLPPTDEAIQTAAESLWRFSEELTHCAIETTKAETAPAVLTEGTVSYLPTTSRAPASLSLGEAVSTNPPMVAAAKKSHGSANPARKALGGITNTAPTKTKK